MQDLKETYQEGAVILIDKAFGWTSFDVVKKVRNTIRVKKVGHAGTLDPLATGLLILCTGRKTKEINKIQELEKTYEGSFYLGAVRPSHDKETEVTETKSLEGLTEEAIRAAASEFSGEIDQVPPAFSAIRKGGKRMYDLARAGKKVELDARRVVIHALSITGIELPLITFRLTCSKGFYVRSLARDFGRALGCGAYLESLRRTAIGQYQVEKAETIQEFLTRIGK